MNARLFSDAMGIIDSSYIEEAAFYQSRRKPMVLAKIAAVAACLVFVAAIIIPTITSKQNQHPVTDIEPKEELTVNDVASNTTYGVLFPKQILEGYVLEEPPCIYGADKNAVLKATYYNYEMDDEMIIRIASKEWFNSHEKASIKFGSVMYRNEQNQGGSYIYIESQEYVIAYSFSTRDIAQIDGFHDMVNSAEQDINY